MIVIALAQIQLSFNVSSLRVSIGGIVADFDTSPTSVGTAIVTNALAMAAFMMLGNRMGALFGSRRLFQATVVFHGLAMLTMALSHSAAVMIVAQGMAGVAAAAMAPALVVIIAANYEGRQRAQALGLLGGAAAMAGVLAFVVAGFLGTVIGWRYAFGLVVPLAACVFFLSHRLKPVQRQSNAQIDWVGVLLAASAITLIGVGGSNISSWGLLMSRPTAPFSFFGLSPATITMVAGLVLGQAFFAWSRQRLRRQKTPLIALEVLNEQRSATLSILIIAALGAAVSFLVPLYIEIVQGRNSLEAASGLVPYSLATVAAAILVVRLSDRLAPRHIARYAFVLVAAGLCWLAIVIRNDWSTFPAILGLTLVGFGQGALVTLLFNVLVAVAPRELAGDVGTLQGTTSAIARGLGTAAATAVAIGLLTMIISKNLVDNPAIPAELMLQVNLDNVTFVSNDRLLDVLERTTATPEQIREAVRVNTAARLQALKLTFFAMAGLALLGIFPASGLPRHVHSEVPSGEGIRS